MCFNFLKIQNKKIKYVDIHKKTIVILILAYIIVGENYIWVITTVDSYKTYKRAYLIVYASTKNVFKKKKTSFT